MPEFVIKAIPYGGYGENNNTPDYHWGDLDEKKVLSFLKFLGELLNLF